MGEIYRNTDIDINIVRKTETEMEERETEKKWTAYKEKQANKKMIWQTHSKRFRQREKIHCPTFLYQCTQLMVKLNIAILSWVYKQKFPKQSNISKSRSQNQYIKNVLSETNEGSCRLNHYLINSILYHWFQCYKNHRYDIIVAFSYSI